MFKYTDFLGQKACVLGSGKSGRAVAELLAAYGMDVLISDANPNPQLQPSLHIEVETGGHSPHVFTCGFFVKSPGILPNSHVLQAAKAQNIPVFSELEVALSFLPRNVKIFAVTGTNGKTTTTALLGEILKRRAAEEKKGQHVWVCGNIGNPVSQCVRQVQEGDVVVIEVSSYQLEDSTCFHPHIACLLNVTPDHLDHHGSMSNYIKSKARLFQEQTDKDVAVLNATDALCAQLAERIQGKVLAFSVQPKHWIKTDVFFDGDELIFSEGAHLRPPKLIGLHNVENAMAAALMALADGVDSEDIQYVFDHFEAIEHRIETVTQVKGVTYINDSKATNLDSTITALKSFDKKQNIWLILGGRDKGASYEVLIPYLKEHCKQVLSIGECMDKIERELNGEFPITRCETLNKAVKYAFEQAVPDDVVLLSPACASFDQFKSYEERGEIFKELVRNLESHS